MHRKSWDPGAPQPEDAQKQNGVGQLHERPQPYGPYLPRLPCTGHPSFTLQPSAHKSPKINLCTLVRWVSWFRFYGPKIPFSCWGEKSDLLKKCKMRVYLQGPNPLYSHFSKSKYRGCSCAESSAGEPTQLFPMSTPQKELVAKVAPALSIEGR